MKKIILSVLVLICLPLFVGAEEMVLRVSSDPWPPWIISEAGQKTRGIAVKTVEEIADRMGFKVEIEVFPFARALHNIMSGKNHDMMLMLSKTPEREAELLFTDPIFYDPYLFFFDSKRVNDFAWQNLEDVKPFNVGVVRGFNYGEKWRMAVEKYNIKTDKVVDDTINLKKLIHGRIDCALLAKTNAYFLIRNNPKFNGRIKFNTKAVSINTYGFAVSRNSSFASMMPGINETISKLREDGTIDRIMDEEIE